nr:hypothetical protein [Tanacetum cinerariifolium]
MTQQDDKWCQVNGKRNKQNEEAGVLETRRQAEKVMEGLKASSFFQQTEFRCCSNSGSRRSTTGPGL